MCTCWSKRRGPSSFGQEEESLGGHCSVFTKSYDLLLVKVRDMKQLICLL